MPNTTRLHLNRIARIVLISVFFLVVLLLSLCGKKSPTGQTDPNDTLDLKDSVIVSASPGTGAITLSWKSHDSLTYVLFWSEKPGVSATSTKIMNVTSPYTLEGLKDNCTYYYRLGIIDADKVTNLSDEIKVTTRPVNVVPNIPVLYASGGDKRVVLFWNNLAEPVTCILYWSKNSGFTKGNCEKITVHTNPYTHANLLDDITYYYRLAVVNAKGEESDWSEQVEAYTHATTEIPTFPTNVNVQERNTMLTLSWTPDGSATSYYIYWAKASGVDKNCSKEKSLTNVFHFSNLVNGTIYYLRISAENSQGEGQLSKEIQGTPKQLEPPRMKATPGYDDIVLDWPAVSNANSYTLTCWSTKAPRDTLYNVHSPFTHDNLDPRVGYTYSIVSVNLDGESKPQVITASPLGLAAPSLSTDTVSYREITIQWAPVKFADSYVVYWDDTTIVSAAAATAVDVGSKTAFVHTGLTPQKKYRYRVRAVKGSDSSDLSPELTCTAKGLPAPKGVRLSAGYKKITITIDSTYTMPDKSPVTFNLYWSDSLKNSLVSPASWIRTGNVRMIGGITLPYTMTGLDIAHFYYVVLGVADGEFEGDPTTILSVKTLDLSPPDSFKVETRGYKELTLLWKGVDSADSYNVYWSATDSVTKSSEKLTAEHSPFVHTGLTVGGKYYYRVASVDSGYESALGTMRAAVVSALAPPSTVGVIADVNALMLSWSAVVVAASYNVYWSQKDDVSKASEKFSCSRIDTVLENLLPETRYYFAVASVNGPDESGLSTVRNNVTIRLLPPPGITVSGGYHSIHVKWNKASYAKFYTVYYSENPEMDTASLHSSVTADSIDLNDLPSRKTYYIRISSVKGTCESALSKAVQATTVALAAPYPVNCTTGYRTISLSWKSIPNAKSFIVAWADTNHVVGPVDSITVTDTFFTHADLKPLKNYWYTVVAANGEDRSNPPAENPAKAGGLAVPYLQVSDIYKGNRLSWHYVPYATSYTLYWSDTLLTIGTPHTVTTTDTFYIHENLLPNKYYWYQVTSTRGSDESEPTTTRSAITGGLTPPVVNATISGSSVKLTAASKYAEVIYIYWSYENNVTTASDTLIKKVDVDYLYHAFDASLDSGKTRYYRAVAVRGEEKSDLSSVKSILLTK